MTYCLDFRNRNLQVSGAVCMLTALVVPFECLNTIISAGVLLAFNFVTSSQLVLRHRYDMLSLFLLWPLGFAHSVRDLSSDPDDTIVAFCSCFRRFFFES